MAAEQQQKNWCEKDQHQDFALFDDFNAWIDQGEAIETELLEKLGDVGLSHPSKAFYAGDREAYMQAYRAYRLNRRHSVLSKDYFIDIFGETDGLHWFERNEAHFDELIRRLHDEMVVPFVGAGASVDSGFPTWSDHLRQQWRTAGLKPEQLEKWLTQGQHEAAIAYIEEKRGADVFIQEIKDVFNKTGSIQTLTLRISELFQDTLITTNYDRLLEQVFETGEDHAVQMISGTNALEKPSPNKVTVIKLHGDIRNPKRCILSKAQYDEAYGNADLSKPIPKLLQYYFKNNSLLFIGCSLNNDRTVQVFAKAKAAAGDFDFPTHFAIEEAPENQEELANRNSELIRLGITAIWFPKGAFDSVKEILSLAKSELQYMQASDNKTVAEETESLQTNAGTNNVDGTDLSIFLHDFVDLMPLLYWINESVPQEHSGKYLRAMQRVFHARSLFTEETNEDLLWGLDNLLRAISNRPNFDGYTVGKLDTAFSAFQKYLLDLGEHNYSNDGADWDVHEMFTIPRSQFEGILDRFNEDDPNLLAIRIAITLLQQGKSQSANPKGFCKLAESVNIELQAYLSLALKDKLKLLTPDRLDNLYTGDVADLCENAWVNFDKPMELGFIEGVRVIFSSFFSR
jgi:NAD-dependent SIR2 family protein deacetylase